MENEELVLEALGILQEECAEVIKEVSKIRRSGAYYKPFDGDKTNMDHLKMEIQDVLVILELLGMRDLDGEHMRKKMEKLRKWSNIVNLRN